MFLYGAATLAQQNDVPTHFWEHGKPGATMLVILGVLAGVGAFIVTFSVKGLLARAQTDGKLITPCHNIAWFFESRAGMPHGTVGVHVWEITGPLIARRLKRRATFRTKASRQMPVLWTRGKGVIGQCWANPKKKDELTDLAALRERAPDETSFCQLPAYERFNMTWQEFEDGKHYDLVWVTKLYRGLGNSPKLWGMLSVDVEVPGCADAVKAALRAHEDEMRTLLNTCEELVS